jgi:hypothetical protein
MRLQQFVNEINDIEQHLKDRGIDFNKTKVFFDKETNTATFLLYNLSGKLVGYQLYNPNGKKGINYSDKTGKNLSKKDLMKYYTYITRESDKTKSIAVYGLDTYNPKSKYLFVVYGIFDAIKLHRQGLPCVAVLMNDPKSYKEWFGILPQKIIAILDNDENKAGNKLKGIADVSYTVYNPYNDLGDMSDKEVKEFINSLGIRGIKL